MMRAAALVATAALTLSACGANDQPQSRAGAIDDRGAQTEAVENDAVPTEGEGSIGRSSALNSCLQDAGFDAELGSGESFDMPTQPLAKALRADNLAEVVEVEQTQGDGGDDLPAMTIFLMSSAASAGELGEALDLDSEAFGRDTGEDDFETGETILTDVQVFRAGSIVVLSVDELQDQQRETLASCDIAPLSEL